MPDVGLQQASDAERQKARETLRRDPYLRVMVAVRNHFGQDYAHLACFMFRFWALIDLLRRKHIQQWVSVDEATNFQEFHPAVLLAGAEVKLTGKAKFPPKRFVQHVERIIQDEATD